MKGFPSISLLLDFIWNGTFELIKSYIRKITFGSFKSGLPEGVILNVNFPKLEEKYIEATEFVDKQKHIGWRNSIKEKHLKEEIIFGLVGDFKTNTSGRR